MSSLHSSIKPQPPGFVCAFVIIRNEVNKMRSIRWSETIHAPQNRSFEVNIAWSMCVIAFGSLSVEQFRCARSLHTKSQNTSKMPPRHELWAVCSISVSFIWEVVENGIKFDVSRSNSRNGVRNPRIVQNIIIQGALTHSCRHTNEIAKSNLSKNSIFYRIVIRLPPGDGKWKMKQTATPNRNSIAPLLEFAVINVRNCFLRQMPPHRLQNQLSIISCWKSVCVCVVCLGAGAATCSKPTPIH